MEENIFDFDSEYQELLAEGFNDEGIKQLITEFLYWFNQILVETTEKTVTSEEQEKANLNLFSIFLNCQGDSAGCDDDSAFRQDLDILFNHMSFELPQEVELFDFTFEDDFFDENFDQLIQMARANIQKIQANFLINTFSLGNNRTYYAYRESVTKLLLLLRCNYQQLRWALL